MDSSAALANAVRAKLEEGNMRAAIQIISSEDTVAPVNDETLSELRSKHPAGLSMHTDLVMDSSLPDLVVNQDKVCKVIASFPPGSAGGPDGLRPQHVKELVHCREAGTDFIDSLTDFVNVVLSGQCPPDIAPFFFGGRLLALRKKSGGIRPIAIGMTLRRIVSKCASFAGIGHLSPYFCPTQLGVGVQSGCEAAVHAARRFLQDLPPDHVMAKLDFSNAFNKSDRSHVVL